MMSVYEAETADWSDEELVEMRYDSLDQDPLNSLEKIYSDLNLPGFAEAKEPFTRYLASVKSFKKNDFSYDEAYAARVESRLRYFIDKWEYDRPGEAL